MVNPTVTNLFYNDKGFTLIELMVVTAVIGILAILALPQLAAYKVRSYNASAISDIRILKTSVEVFYSENKTYP